MQAKFSHAEQVHFRPQTRTAAKIKTPTSPIIDVVKSQSHITDVFRFMTPCVALV
jgi:hypothetical protein